MLKIVMQPVQSSNISKVGYDEENKTLAIAFSNGVIYHYADVKKDVFDDLLAAKSLGKHVHEHIKGRFKFARQEED